MPSFPEPDMQAVEVHELGKAFAGRPAVRSLSLSIGRGELFAFLGPNGSGKTTTMRMLCGLLTPDHGTGQCLGFDLRRQQRGLRPLIGYMSQHFSLYDDLTVEENLRFVVRAFAMPKKSATDDIERIIERFALQPHRRKLAGALSGGWKQRLALACALLHRPQLLLLDEPTSGVDPEARSFFWSIMQAEAADGMTAMISTHYLDEVQQYCDRMAYILDGEIRACGTPAEVIAESGLHAVLIPGGDQHLVERARKMPEILYAAQTTAGVFLTGEDRDSLTRQARALGYPEIEEVAPRLEEVFQNLARRGT